MREIILDTETTGLSHQNGDRLIEIGCIELVNRIPSGREFHRFVNPQRDVPAEAEAIHGLVDARSCATSRCSPTSPANSSSSSRRTRSSFTTRPSTSAF